MKNFKNYIAWVALIALIFTSCSKEDVPGPSPDSNDVATLSFGPVVNDMLNKAALTKQTQESDIPECSEDAPAFAQISLDYGNPATTIDVVVPILSDENGLFTAYDDALEIPIPSGETTVSVTLNTFAVWNDVGGSPGEVIWLAPITGSEYADFVTQSLPFSWDLRAGSKTYTNVDVLCYDDRDVNLYGYQFFDITPVPLIEFCIFGNYCTESGRHYPASYSVDIWEWADGQKGNQLYDDVTSEVMDDNGTSYADPLCVFLPDREGQDEYFVEIFLLDTDEYDGPNRVILSGVITDDEIKSFFNGDNLDYYHFQFGCDEGTPPPFQDPEDEAKHYKACVKSLDDTYAIGFAYLRLQGTSLTATVLAANVAAGEEHPQHIHENASCDDYGDVFWALDYEGGDYPVADANGFVNYTRDFTLTADQAANADFGNRTVVLHGVNVDDNYELMQPIACGEFSLLEY